MKKINNRVIVLIFGLLIMNLLSCDIFKKELSNEEITKYYIAANENFMIEDYYSSYTNYKKIVKYKNDDGIFLYRYGFSLDKGINKPKKAIKYYNKALNILDSKEDLDYRAAAFFNLGYIYQKYDNPMKSGKNFASAFSILTRMYEMGDIDPESLFRLAFCYDVKKNSEEALAVYKEAIEKFESIYPGHYYHAVSYYNMGVIHHDMGERVETLKAWEKAIDLRPDKELFIQSLNDLKMNNI